MGKTMENLDQKAPKSHFQSSGSTCSESQQTSDLKKSGNHGVKVGAAGKHSQLGNIQDKKKQPSATFSTRTYKHRLVIEKKASEIQ